MSRIFAQKGDKGSSFVGAGEGEEEKEVLPNEASGSDWDQVEGVIGRGGDALESIETAASRSGRVHLCTRGEGGRERGHVGVGGALGRSPLSAGRVAWTRLERILI